MRSTSWTPFLLLLLLSGALTLASCSASPETSPVASSATEWETEDAAIVTAAGNGLGPGGPGPGGPGPGGGLCGNACTGPVGPDPDDIVELLSEAVQEEYKAEMLYRSVLEDFGPDALPFAGIADSELRHVAALQRLFERRQLAAPASAWTRADFAPFATLEDACAAGVAAEIADADFYAPHLERSDLPQDVVTVFTNLQAASLQNHLPAFERCQCQQVGQP